jgi:hypothetical protein
VKTLQLPGPYGWDSGEAAHLQLTVINPAFSAFDATQALIHDLKKALT